MNYRLKAASTCRERNWTIGTWLRSKKWKKDRRIVQIGKHTDYVSFKDSDNNTYESMTFPPDVIAVLGYPEHDKLKAISDKSQAIGEFVEWLDGKGIHLAAFHEQLEGELRLDHTPIQDLLAEFFNIDQKKLEAEKDAMVEAQRELNRRVG